MSAQEPLFSSEDRDYLYKIFANADHEVREGATTKTGKVQWFIYLTWEAIQLHLDSRFFGEWSDEYHNPRDLDGYSETYCRITIRGMYRENNGSNSANSKSDENQGKGAATDAFKRCAAKWGMGLYLREAPKVYTAYDYKNNGKTDYTKKAQREREALNQFYKWLDGLRRGQPQQQVTVLEQPEQPQSSNPQTDQPKELVTNEILMVGVKKKGNNRYIVADGCTFFSRDVFKALEYSKDVIESLGNVGMQNLPDPIRIVYTEKVGNDNNTYKEPLRVKRLSTGEVIDLNEMKEAV